MANDQGQRPELTPAEHEQQKADYRKDLALLSPDAAELSDEEAEAEIDSLAVSLTGDDRDKSMTYFVAINTERDKLARESEDDLNKLPHAVTRVGQQILALYYDQDAKEGRGAGFISTLRLKPFLGRLSVLMPEAELAASQVDAETPKVDVTKLRTPESMNDEEVASTFLVRAESADAIVVWERTGDYHSQVSVVSNSWDQVEAHLIPFVAPFDQESVAQRIVTFQNNLNIFGSKS